MAHAGNVVTPITPPFDEATFLSTWPFSYEKCFVQLLQEESFSGRLKDGMTSTGYRRLALELNKRTAARFTAEMLEDEFLRLKSMYRYFSLVTEQEGYYWTPFGNQVINNVKNWEAFVKEYPFAAQYKSEGEPLWTELWSIFHNNFKFGSLGKAIIEDSTAEKGNKNCPILISDSEDSVGVIPERRHLQNQEDQASEPNVLFCSQESVNNFKINYFAPKPSTGKPPKPFYEKIGIDASSSKKKSSKIPSNSSASSLSLESGFF